MVKKCVFGRRTNLHHHFAAKPTTPALILRALFLLSLLTLLVRSAAAAQSFAIADFDGDQRPDFARIETARIDASATEYRIELLLSASGPQAINIVAPSGGLLMEPRDVANGNHFIDIVLTTAWFRHPVAVLINDGRASFSRVEPTAFPQEFTASTENWSSAPSQVNGVGRVPPQPAPKACLEPSDASGVRKQIDSILPSSRDVVTNSSLISHSGRAPPRTFRSH